MHVDVGTGDGAFVQRMARRHPGWLVIGIDASVDRLRDLSRKVAGKAEKGGLPNALFGRLSLGQAPGELASLADAVTVLLPWGSLLRATALPEPAALCRLRALCRPAADLMVLFGYGPHADGAAIRELGLQTLDDPAVSALEGRYSDSGFAVRARPVPLGEVRALPTTWAKKLAFSDHGRRFIEIRGRAKGREPLSTDG